MKLYCENDVRSMIAVEYLIRKIVTIAQKTAKIIPPEQFDKKKKTK